MKKWFNLFFEQYNFLFITNELTPVIYTIKDIWETVYSMEDHKRISQIEYDAVSLKKNLFWLNLVVFLAQWELMISTFSMF